MFSIQFKNYQVYKKQDQIEMLEPEITRTKTNWKMSL